MKVNEFDFSHYYTYAELVNYLTQMAEDYPKLVDLQVLGKSYAGRDIWLATLTSQVTGSPLTKPRAVSFFREKTKISNKCLFLWLRYFKSYFGLRYFSSI